MMLNATDLHKKEQRSINNNNNTKLHDLRENLTNKQNI